MIHWNLNFFVGFRRAYQALSHVLLRTSALRFTTLRKRTHFQIFWGLFSDKNIDSSQHQPSLDSAAQMPASTLCNDRLVLWPYNVSWCGFSWSEKRTLIFGGWMSFVQKLVGLQLPGSILWLFWGWWMCSLIGQRQWIWVFWFLKHLERHNLRHLALFGS